MINPEDVEIKSQAHLMYAEGCHYFECKPSIDEISEYIEKKGFFMVKNEFDMWHDEMMDLWRWTCPIRNEPLYKYKPIANPR